MNKVTLFKRICNLNSKLSNNLNKIQDNSIKSVDFEDLT